jgi:hypothetical protein
MANEEIKKELRSLRFLGEYGFPDSLPDDYVETISSHFDRVLFDLTEVRALIQEAVDGFTPNESFEHYEARLRSLYEDLTKDKIKPLIATGIEIGQDGKKRQVSYNTDGTKDIGEVIP